MREEMIETWKCQRDMKYFWTLMMLSNIWKEAEFETSGNCVVVSNWSMVID